MHLNLFISIFLYQDEIKLDCYQKKDNIGAANEPPQYVTLTTIRK